MNKWAAIWWMTEDVDSDIESSILCILDVPADRVVRDVLHNMPMDMPMDDFTRDVIEEMLD